MPTMEPQPLVSSDDMLWRDELRASLRTPEALVAAGLLTAEAALRLHELDLPFELAVTPSYAALIDRKDPRCPIGLQALPSLTEQDPVLPPWAEAASQRIYGAATPWRADAIGDLARLVAPRLTHRYGNRALLHVSSHCSVYCRFCFRKAHLSTKEEALYGGDFAPALSYLRTHTEVTELILTGGDPLTLTDTALTKLLDAIEESVPHIRVLRIHSRVAVTLASRLTAGLARTLTAPRPYLLTLVSHFNHPRELSAAARTGLLMLRRGGIPLYNQSVLLHGVNDDAATLAALFQLLYENGITPMYLHHADWTPGTFHFRVSVARGQGLYRELQGRVAGPALPRYVLDLPGGFGKVPVSTLALSEELPQDLERGFGGGIYSTLCPHRRGGQGREHVSYLDLHRLL